MFLNLAFPSERLSFEWQQFSQGFMTNAICKTPRGASDGQKSEGIWGFGGVPHRHDRNFPRVPKSHFASTTHLESVPLFQRDNGTKSRSSEIIGINFLSLLGQLVLKREKEAISEECRFEISSILRSYLWKLAFHRVLSWQPMTVGVRLYAPASPYSTIRRHWRGNKTRSWNIDAVRLSHGDRTHEIAQWIIID